MPGPSVLALGPFVFEAIGFGLTERGHRTATPWADIAVAGSLNAAQWTGGESVTEEITGVLFPAEFGGLATLEGLELAARAGQVLPLVAPASGAANIFGMWIIEGVQSTGTFIDADGVPHRNAYTLSIRAAAGTAPGPAASLLSLITA